MDGIGAQRRRRALQADGAAFEDIAVMGEFQRQAGILFDQQDGGAGLVEPLDDLHGLEHQLGRKAHRRLVEQQDLRPVHQRPADRQHLLLAARQERAVLILPLVWRIGNWAKTCSSRCLREARVGDGEGAEFEVFAHAEAAQHMPALRHVHDAGAGDLVGAHLR